MSIECGRATVWFSRGGPMAGTRRLVRAYDFRRRWRRSRYCAGIAEIVVTPSTGAVQVTKFTIGADCGIINPRQQLDRCIKGGVTSTDWSRYNILRMQEMPESGWFRSRGRMKALAPVARHRTQLRLQQWPPLVRRDGCGTHRKILLTSAYVMPLLKGREDGLPSKD